MPLIEKIARDIADALGDNFDYAFNSKPEWTAARGETKAGYRDVNQPYKSDYLDAAQAALTAIMGEGDGVQQCDREAAADLYLDQIGDEDGFADRIRANTAQPGCDAWEQAFARHRSTAAAAERARIVAAIRLCELSSAIPDDPAQIISDLADAIERGEV